MCYKTYFLLIFQLQKKACIYNNVGRTKELRALKVESGELRVESGEWRVESGELRVESNKRLND